VSTDSPEIGRVAREAGAEVPFLRPQAYATGRATTAAVALHALAFLEQAEGWRFELVVILQPTSPLRIPEDIERSLAILRQSGADTVVSVTRVHVRRSYLLLNDRGLLCRPFSGGAQDGFGPELYKINGAVYLTRVETLRRTGHILGDKVAPYVMPRIRSLDIDTRDDLYLVRLILEDRERRPARIESKRTRTRVKE